MDPLVFLVVVVVVLIAVVFMSSLKSSREGTAAELTSERVQTYGIQKEIIKQTDANLYGGTYKINPGKLILTWDTLYFFGSEGEIKIPVNTIRSVSSEQKSDESVMVVQADDGTYRYSWDNIRKTMPGMAATGGGGIGFGAAISKSLNPVVQEWQQLIDDLRFGRIKKPL